MDAFDALAHLDTTDPTRDDPHRDRPAHRRIEHLVTQLMAWSTRAGPDTDRAVLRTAGHLLAQRPDLVHHAARLLVHGVVLDGDPAPTTRHLDELCDRLTGRPVAAAAAAKILARRLAQERPANPDHTLDSARHLAGRAAPAAGLFAAALASHAAALGWPPPWRDRVLQLRGHESADVRAAALELTMATEGPPTRT